MRYTALALMALLAACSGGSGGGTTPPTGGGGGVTPTPCPAGYTGTAPSCTLATSGSTSIPIGTSSSNPAIPQVAGYSGNIQIPAASASTTLDLTVSTSLPAGYVAIQAAPKRAAVVADNPLLYFTATVTSAVTLNGTFGLSIVLPAGASTTGPFYLAAFVPSTGWVTVAGPASVSGAVVTIPQAGGTIALSPNTTLLFALYSGSTLAPAPPITSTPDKVQILDASSTQSVTVAENVAGTTFTFAPSGCSGIANVTTTGATGFSVAAFSNGTCSVTVNDNHGNALSVPVSVTTTTVVPK